MANCPQVPLTRPGGLAPNGPPPAPAPFPGPTAIGPAPDAVLAGSHRPPGWLRRHWRRTLLVALTGLAGLLAWLYLPPPDRSLWPPAVRDERNVVYVAVGQLHAAIDLPDWQLGVFQEWHMGASGWIRSGHQGWLDALAMGLWPSPAVVRFGVFARSWWERQGLGSDRVFKFYLSPEGRQRMLARLHRDRGELLERVGSYFLFQHRRPYHALANCNNYIGGALEAAGLPIREVAALEAHILHWQLRRCRVLQQEAAAARPDGPPAPTPAGRN